MNVTVVVVNHDGGEEILECLRSVRASSVPVEVVVVDNASTDGSPERVQKEVAEILQIHNEANLGFGAAANIGVREARSPFVVLLNPDATVAPGAIAALVRALEERPRAAAAGPLVRNPDGSVQPSRRAFPSLWHSLLHGIVGPLWPNNPGTRAYTLAGTPTDRPSRVDWVSGSAVALRRVAFDEVGGFDESFFFFMEDVDLCKRLGEAGWEVWFCPGAEAVHAWGGSWTRRPLRFLWLHQRNMFRYVRKHRRGAWVLAYPIIAAGIGLRFVMMSVRWLVSRRTIPSHRGGRRN